MRIALSCIAIVMLLSAPVFCADAEPVETKVDKALTKPKQDIQRFWVTPEFLMMWSKDGPVHDVGVTTNIVTWTDPAARFIFKNNDQDYGMQLGGRLTFGMWADDERKWGFELSGFALMENEDHFAARNNLFNFPVFETRLGREIPEDSPFYSRPVPLKISSASQLWSVEGQGLHNLKRGENLSLDLAFGIKHLDLSEDFQLHLAPGNDIVIGGYSDHMDSFETNNRFLGAKAGLKFQYTAWERLLIDVQPAVSLGADMEELHVSGHFIEGGAHGPGFLYTGASNIGTHRKTDFAVVPEMKVGLGCKVAKNITFNASYNFLYASDVLRPGWQITRRVNESQILGGVFGPTEPPADPHARMKSSDYWAQGIGVNLKIKF
jgi:hypothetical protein